jgi:hypothetical protein
MKTRRLRFPEPIGFGYLHTRRGGYPYTFHGRYKKEGGLLEDTENPGWKLLGEAVGEQTVTSDCVLLEVLAEPAKDLSPLSALNPDDLEGIWLGNTLVDDSQLHHIRHLTGLQWLDVQNNGNITNAGIAQLVGLNSLRFLGMHWTRVTDEGLRYLYTMKELRNVDVWGCEIGTEAIAELKSHLPNCSIRTE